jgi:hypothetical protein
METKAVKPNRYNYGTVMIVSTLLVFLALGTAGCTHNSKGIEVLPLGNRNVLTLAADDVVQVMRAAGFSDAQIWEHGTALRDGLANSGAVQIKIDGTVEAVFAINGDSVYISTLGRGHFVYNVKTGWVNSGQR